MQNLEQYGSLIRQTNDRYIGGNLTCELNAGRLSHFCFLELRLMEAQASWIPFIPHLELKVEIPYHYYEDAVHVNELRERLPELRAFDKAMKPFNPHFIALMNELTNTEDTIEQLAGVYWVLRPQLAAAYKQHLLDDDPVANNPTYRILEKAIADHEKFAAWGDQTIRALATGDDLSRAEAWRDHLLHILDAAGGILGNGEVKPLPALRDGEDGRRFRKDSPRRDNRFRVGHYVRTEGRAATDVWDKETLKRYFFHMVEGEIEATECCSRTLYDFNEMPWEFRFQVARQAWDEARHAELSIQTFLEMGGTFDMITVRDTFPLYLGPGINNDLGRRLVHLNQVVEGWVTDDFAMMADICRGLGDEKTARLFEYLIADEWGHIKIGADWLPKVTGGDQSYREEVVDYRLAVERELYSSLRTAATEVAGTRKLSLFESVQTGEQTQPTP